MDDSVNDEDKDSIRNGLVGGNNTTENGEVIDISIETENKDKIHRDITDNETEQM